MRHFRFLLLHLRNAPLDFYSWHIYTGDELELLAHAKYVSNGGGGTSWHYTASSDGIYHHIPDTENAYHAGDGGRDYIMYNSNVFGNNLNPVVTISSDGFYEIDGVKSKVLAPTNDGEILTTDKINDKEIKNNAVISRKT